MWHWSQTVSICCIHIHQFCFACFSQFNIYLTFKKNWYTLLLTIFQVLRFPKAFGFARALLLVNSRMFLHILPLLDSFVYVTRTSWNSKVFNVRNNHSHYHAHSIGYCTCPGFDFLIQVINVMSKCPTK